MTQNGGTALSEEEVCIVSAIMDAQGVQRGIPVNDSRLLMELLWNNLIMFPTGGDEIMSMASGTHPLLH